MAGRRQQSYPIVVRELEVLETLDVTPLTRRVVLTGDQLGAFHNNGYDIAPFRTENADDHVKIVILDPDDPSVRPPEQADGHLDWSSEAIGRARDYTPRRYLPEQRRLEIDFVRHPGGLASAWAERVAPGDRVHVAGPRGTTVLPPDIDWYFLVGDETALPAIARRVEELPAGTPVTAVVSVPAASEEQTFAHQAELDITWVHRDTAGPTALLDAIAAAPWRDGQVYAWAAGEAEMLRPVRRWFAREKGVDRGHTDVAGYWRAGQSQREAGQQQHRLQHLVDLSVPYAVRAAVTLDLAELVTDGHRTIPALAKAAGVDAGGLRRLLRLLAHEELFTLGSGGTVDLAPAGSVLLEDRVHDRLDHRNGWARLDGSWPGLLDALRTGTSGFAHARGHSLWDELGGDQRLERTFHQVLSQTTSGWAPAVARRLALTDERVVDVGGGNGTLLAAVLARYPEARGTLVDLPSTAEQGRAELAERGFAERVDIAAQSFFEPLPTGGDVYTLAQVLHDWPDAEAVNILTRIAEAAGDARIVVVERLADTDDDGLDDHQELTSDLLMFSLFGGGERSREDFAALAGRAGLRLEGTTALPRHVYLLHLRRAG